MAKKLVYGVGINDADYFTQTFEKVNGVARHSFACPYYKRWSEVLKRCYSKKAQASRPDYVGCLICDEWKTFSKFKLWMESQDWKGKELDKDILVVGNRIYSPETCAFVDQNTNSFVSKGRTRGSAYKIGAHLHQGGKFEARCKNPFTKKQECLGKFLLEDDAHRAWKKRKHELACQLADLQTDQRVANALRARYI